VRLAVSFTLFKGICDYVAIHHLLLVLLFADVEFRASWPFWLERGRRWIRRRRGALRGFNVNVKARCESLG